MPRGNGQFQHYISQFLLRNFKDKTYRQRKIWRYTLDTNECTLEGINEVAGISDIWDKESEKEISILESKSSKIIKEIIKSKKERRTQLTINNDDYLILINYVIWLNTIQPKRAEFILNHSKNKDDCEKWLYTSSEISEEQEKLQLSYREQYEKSGKIPDILALKRSHISYMNGIYDNFCEIYLLCAPIENPFVLSDHYVTPIIKNDYEKGENSYESVAQFYFPLASEICLVLNNKKLLKREIKDFSENVSIDDINRTAVALAKESKGNCIYGSTCAVLEKAVKDYNQKDYLGWKPDRD